MKNNQQGFTFIELLIVILISSLLVGAISIFVGRIFNVNREQQEQVLITEDARNNIKRMAESVRNSVNSVTDEGDEIYWLQLATDYEIVFLSNVDADGSIEKVHYYLEGTDLVRGITEPNPDGKYPPGQENKTIQIISRNIRNGEDGVPLFRYHSAGNGPDSELDPESMAKSSVKRIVLNLLVDADINRAPNASVVTTQVTPRRVVDPKGVESERLEPIDVVLPASGDQAILTWQGLEKSETISMLELNSRLSTYHQRRSTWQTKFENSWRVKVLDDVIQLEPTNELKNDGCLAPEYNDVSFVLANCQERTATDPSGESVTYKPIFIYTDPNNEIIDYIRDIIIAEE